MMKIDMLKVTLKLFQLIIFVAIICSFLLVYTKVDQSVPINGLIINDNNQTILVFNKIEDENDFINLGANIYFIDKSTSKEFSGKVVKKEKVDLGISEVSIINYNVLIEDEKFEYKEEQYYSFIITNKEKISLLKLYLE